MPAWVPISASDFGGSFAAINGARGLRVNKLDIARATYFLGNTDPYRDTPPTMRRRATASLFGAQAVTVRGARLHLIDEILTGDPEDKRFASYYLGTALARLFSERNLRLPHALSLRQALRAWGIRRRGKRIPDFLAYDGVRFVVVEAKGRLELSTTVLDDAKSQARAIRRINGAPPDCLCASVAVLGSSFQVIVADPPEESHQKTFELEASPQAYYSAYYEPILNFLSKEDSAREPIDESRDALVLRRHSELSMAAGVTREVLDWSLGGFRGSPPRQRPISLPTLSIGSDGTTLAVDDEAVLNRSAGSRPRTLN